METKKSIGFRKTALKKEGNFTPVKQGMRTGVGIVKDQPKTPKVKKQ